MPLTCELGWHRADPRARWNDGYYFSKCTRCGRDLVRTAYQRWHVPKGYKVVWQPHPPEPRRPALRVHEAETAPSPAPELPIQEVLRHLEARDLTNDGGVGCEDEAPDTPPPAASEDVHFATVRVTEIRVDQLLVSEVQVGPASKEIGEEQDADPELPFEGSAAAAGETAEPEAELPVEDPAAEPAEAAEAATPPPAEAAEAPAPPPVEPAEAPAPAMQPARRSAFDDFMADDPDPGSWGLGARRGGAQSDRIEGEDALPGGGADEISTSKPMIEDEHHQDTPRIQGLAEGSDSLAPFDDEEEAELEGAKKVKRPSLLSAFSRRSPAAEAEEGAEIQPVGQRFSLSGRLAVASLVAAAVLMLASLVQRPPSKPAAAPAAPAPRSPSPAPSGVAAVKRDIPAPPVRATGPALFPARQKAFVTARILNCRASPVEQAGSVKKLSRGAEVEILAREADWMSISHDGRQCWAAVRYISPDRPA